MTSNFLFASVFLGVKWMIPDYPKIPMESRLTESAPVPYLSDKRDSTVFAGQIDVAG
jgi:hypothetical protein